MLNGRTQGNDNWTSISHRGRSVIDYICTTHENLGDFTSFNVFSMSDVIRLYSMAAPEHVPDHSIIQCSLQLPSNTDMPPLDTRSIPINLSASKRFKIQLPPDDFMQNEELQSRILDAINHIENDIDSRLKINNIYNEWSKVVAEEMERVFEPVTIKSNSDKRHKSFKKPYWNNELQTQWDITAAAEKFWLKCKDTYQKKVRKETYCIERRHFDQLNRKYKRAYQQQEKLHLLDLQHQINSRDFWQHIGKIGMATDRKRPVPWEHIDSAGSVTKGQDPVLTKWAETY